MNAKVERLNRTTQEEFYIRYKSLLWDNIEAFNKKLVKWVLWYNTERPHWSLKFLSPLKFYCREIFKQKYNLGWTCTPILLLFEFEIKLSRQYADSNH